MATDQPTNQPASEIEHPSDVNSDVDAASHALSAQREVAADVNRLFDAAVHPLDGDGSSSHYCDQNQVYQKFARAADAAGRPFATVDLAELAATIRDNVGAGTDEFWLNVARLYQEMARIQRDHVTVNAMVETMVARIDSAVFKALLCPQPPATTPNATNQRSPSPAALPNLEASEDGRHASPSPNPDFGSAASVPPVDFSGGFPGEPANQPTSLSGSESPSFESGRTSPAALRDALSYLLDDLVSEDEEQAADRTPPDLDVVAAFRTKLLDVDHLSFNISPEGLLFWFHLGVLADSYYFGDTDGDPGGGKIDTRCDHAKCRVHCACGDDEVCHVLAGGVNLLIRKVDRLRLEFGLRSRGWGGSVSANTAYFSAVRQRMSVATLAAAMVAGGIVWCRVEMLIGAKMPLAQLASAVPGVNFRLLAGPVTIDVGGVVRAVDDLRKLFPDAVVEVAGKPGEERPTIPLVAMAPGPGGGSSHKAEGDEKTSSSLGKPKPPRHGRKRYPMFGNLGRPSTEFSAVTGHSGWTGGATATVYKQDLAEVRGVTVSVVKAYPMAAKHVNGPGLRGEVGSYSFMTLPTPRNLHQAEDQLESYLDKLTGELAADPGGVAARHGGLRFELRYTVDASLFYETSVVADILAERYRGHVSRENLAFYGYIGVQVISVQAVVANVKFLMDTAHALRTFQCDHNRRATPSSPDGGEVAKVEKGGKVKTVAKAEKGGKVKKVKTVGKWSVDHFSACRVVDLFHAWGLLMTGYGRFLGQPNVWVQARMPKGFLTAQPGRGPSQAERDRWASLGVSFDRTVCEPVTDPQLADQLGEAEVQIALIVAQGLWWQFKKNGNFCVSKGVAYVNRVGRPAQHWGVTIAAAAITVWEYYGPKWPLGIKLRPGCDGTPAGDERPLRSDGECESASRPGCRVVKRARSSADEPESEPEPPCSAVDAKRARSSVCESSDHRRSISPDPMATDGDDFGTRASAPSSAHSADRVPGDLTQSLPDPTDGHDLGTRASDSSAHSADRVPGDLTQRSSSPDRTARAIAPEVQPIGFRTHELDCYLPSVLQAMLAMVPGLYAIARVAVGVGMEADFFEFVRSVTGASFSSVPTRRLAITCRSERAVPPGDRVDAAKFFEWVCDALKGSAADKALAAFRGARSGTRVCPTCSASDVVEIPFRLVQLPVGDPRQYRPAMTDCLDRAFADEDVDWECSCGARSRTPVSARISVFPTCLVLNASLFSPDGKHPAVVGGFHADLDLQQFAADGVVAPRYRIKAVVLHAGATLEVGRFFTYLRRGDSAGGKQRWWRCNGHAVAELKRGVYPVGRVDTHTKAPYIFFYERVPSA